MNDDSIAVQARAADLAKVRQARAMSAFEKFDAGASLFEEACAWNLAGIAHQHPQWDDTVLPCFQWVKCQRIGKAVLSHRLGQERVSADPALGLGKTWVQPRSGIRVQGKRIKKRAE